MTGTLIVLRHGETEWSRDRRHTGRSDIPLLPEGEAQAVAAGAVLNRLFGGGRPGLVLTSPLERAVRTAELAGYPAGGTDERLFEYDYGVYEGITTDQIHETRPNWLLWDDGCPSGEMPDEVGERVDSLLDEVVRPALSNGDVLLVAHSHVLRILTARWLCMPAGGGRHFVLDPAGIAELGAEHGNPALLHWNLTG